MPNALRVLKSIEAGIGHAEEWLGMAAVAALAIVVNLQIFSRYLFHAPFIWPEEISRLLLVWTTFIGAAALTRRAGDLAVDTFIEMMPYGPRRAFLILRDTVMIVLFGFVALQGFALANAVAGMPLVATGLPTALLAWPVVLGGVLTVFHCALRLVMHIAVPVSVDQHLVPKTLT
ncbi:TRAP transporter small permease [Devosia rhizoryzae]|uniref:TRAP transporter small permease protein n=1 Tax=Devosia rhizoryzae TaxID=2774137 RepID=A0ABX7C6S2_9HYPH|nr:TRAP transporter small permease [Devosia rhizoryzae]QQR38427.1 TRAP transporter small permease [Devosia rhizoryzae]